MVLEGGLQLCAAFLEESKLMSRELVEAIAVGADKWEKTERGMMAF